MNNPEFDSSKQFTLMYYSENEFRLIVSNFDSQGVDAKIFIPGQTFDYFWIKEDQVCSIIDFFSAKSCLIS
jgi:hypothetical protein